MSDKRPPGRPRKNKRYPVREFVPPADDGAPQLLQDYRHVYNNHPDHDKTNGHAQAREMIEKDRKSFMVAMARMEREFREMLPAGALGGPKKQDMGSERAEELIARLLDEFELEEAKRDAELAARPNAAAIGASLQESLAGALEREKQLRERLKEFERNGSGKVGGDPARAPGQPDNTSEAR